MPPLDCVNIFIHREFLDTRDALPVAHSEKLWRGDNNGKHDGERASAI
jgi:hypothetical protein